MIRILKHILRPFLGWIKSVFSIASLMLANPNLKLGGNLFIARCTFGEYVYIASDSTIADSSFGDFSYCSIGAKISTTTIGKFTCIGPNVTIGLGRHPVGTFTSIHPIFYSKAGQLGKTFVRKQYFDEQPLPTKIGNDVWIGAGVIIPGGITIGDGAVIASGAVIVKDVLPYQIVGGVPAKLIKYRFSDEIIRGMIDSLWWNWPIEELERYASKFGEPNDFLSWARDYMKDKKLPGTSG